MSSPLRVSIGATESEIVGLIDKPTIHDGALRIPLREIEAGVRIYCGSHRGLAVANKINEWIRHESGLIIPDARRFEAVSARDLLDAGMPDFGFTHRGLAQILSRDPRFVRTTKRNVRYFELAWTTRYSVIARETRTQLAA